MVSAAGYEKAVTQAFGEVSTALSGHQQLAKAYSEQLTSVEAYRESVRLSTIRYDRGSRVISISLMRKFRCIQRRALRLLTTLAGNWPLSICIRRLPRMESERFALERRQRDADYHSDTAPLKPVAGRAELGKQTSPNRNHHFMTRFHGSL